MNTSYGPFANITDRDLERVTADTAAARSRREPTLLARAWHGARSGIARQGTVQSYLQRRIRASW